MESLRRLANVGSFSVLQDKLERWLDDYALNTTEQNNVRCCEVIELNARVQAQLFRLMDIISGGAYGSAALRARLLPWTGSSLWPSYLWSEPSFTLMEESARKERQLNDMQDTYERTITDIEDDLNVTRDEANELKNQLDDTRAELEDEKRLSSSSKIGNESEIRELRAKLFNAQDEILRLQTQLDESRKNQHLLKMELIDTKDLAISDVVRNGDIIEPPLKPILSKRSMTSLTRSHSPLDPDDVTQKVRQSNLINRFNDMFAQDRLDAMDTLRRFSDDYEMNQRILFTAMQEAFTTAKLAFSTYKMRVRSNLAGTHFGPETLEEAVQDYINRHTDMYDLPGMVSDVVRALNRNPKLYLTPQVSFTIIQPFIREACKMAWNMSALATPLDITVAVDAELFDDNKYRRSYDSEYTAALVNHHIWPCLTQGYRVIMKGEGCTRRGASLNATRSRSPVRSSSPLRTRSRSVSPLRSLSPSRVSRARSRSPSPRRKLDLNGTSSSTTYVR